MNHSNKTTPAVNRRKLPLDQAAFSDPLGRPDAAYFCGLLMADGNLRPYGGTWVLSLELSGEDGEHVAAFRDFLRSGHKLRTKHPQPVRRQTKAGPRVYPAQPSTVLSVSSPQLGEDLIRQGVTPRKTGTGYFRAGLEASRDAWRGCMDGDGHVSITQKSNGESPRPELGLSGGRALVDQFASYAGRIVPLCARPRFAAENGYWVFHTSGYPAYRLIEHLYRPGDVSLPRKARKAAEILTRFAGIRPKPETDCSQLNASLLAEWRAELGSWRKVAVAHGIPLTAIFRVRQKANQVPRTRRHRWSYLTPETIDALRHEHGSWGAVARMLGMTDASVLRAVRRRLGMGPAPGV